MLNGINMKNTFFKPAIMAFTVASIGITGNSASAVPITGEMMFGGQMMSIPAAAWEQAIGLDFLMDFSFGATGDLTAIPDFTFNSLNDFQFTDTGFDLFSNLNGFTFTLDSINVTKQTATNLIMTGNGILSAAGYDDTAYTWSFSSDKTSTVSAFSSTLAPSPASPTPEPTTMLLFGTGIVGIVGMSRRKKEK